MPLAFALLFGLFAGGALAWVAHHARAGEKPISGAVAPFEIVSGFTWLVYAPTVAYFVICHGDWAYLYWVPWRRVPSALDLVLVLAVSASIPTAFALGTNLLRKGQTQNLIASLSTLALLLLVLLIATSRRLAIDATYTEYHGSFAGEPVLAGALGRGIVLAWFVLSFGIFWSVRALRKGGRGAQRRGSDGA